MATEPRDFNAELTEAYRKFEAADAAGDSEAAQEFKTYAEQIEQLAKSRRGALPEAEPEPAAAALPEEKEGWLSGIGRQSVRVGPVPIPIPKGFGKGLAIGAAQQASSYLSTKELARQRREAAVKLVQSKMPQEWLEDKSLKGIRRTDDFQAFDTLARDRFGKKYDEIVDSIAADPTAGKLIDEARKDDGVDIYNNLIRPYFSKDGPDLAVKAEGLVERLRNSYTEEERASAEKPWLAKDAEFFEPGSWFDGTTKAPWHDYNGFMLAVAENAIPIAESIGAARVGGSLGARGALAAIGGSKGKGLDLVSKVMSRGATAGGTVAGTVTEGVMIRDQVTKETNDRLMALDDETWQTSEEYQGLRNQGMSDTEAKQIVSSGIALKAGNTAMVISGAMGAPSSAFFGRLAGGQAGKLASGAFVQRITGAAKGALVEGIPEGAQEVVEQAIGSMGVRRVNPDQDVFEGAGEAFAGGFFVSSPMGALGGMTGAKKGPGLSKDQQTTIDAMKPWEKAASERWKLQNRVSEADETSLTAEERLAQLDQLEKAQKKEAEAFLKAEPVLRRHMIANNRPDEEIGRLDRLRASANTMLAHVQKTKEERTDAQKEVANARKIMAERQKIVDAVESDVLQRDDLQRIVTNIETVRNKGALDQEGYDELEEKGYGRYSEDKSRFLITHKGLRAMPEIKKQLELTKARISGEYAGQERRADTKLRKRMESMTPEQFEAAVYRDPTTGVLNRRAFDEAEAETETEKPKAYAEVDVDSLKWVNDNMSSETGDRMLKQVANALAQQEGVKVYRVGGDEFTVTGESEEQVERAIQQAKIEIEDSQPLTEGDESILPSITWATAKDRSTASAKMKKQKDAREKKGKRAKRGEKPGSYRNLAQGLLLHTGKPPTKAMQLIEKFKLSLLMHFDKPPKSMNERAAIIEQMREELVKLTGKPLSAAEKRHLDDIFEQDEEAKAQTRHVLMHGTDYSSWYLPSYAINNQMADLLRSKRLTGIWCNADDYFKPNKLNGFVTGMFISEVSEANAMGVENVTQAQVDESNNAFARIVGKHIDRDEERMYIEVLAEYGALAESNPVVKYNIKEMREGLAPTTDLTEIAVGPEAEAEMARSRARIAELKKKSGRRGVGSDKEYPLKTLVIHPKDDSTDFLKPIYTGHPGWTVTTGGETISELKALIEKHDHIVMMGHGSPAGLFAIGQFKADPETESERQKRFSESYPHLAKMRAAHEWYRTERDSADYYEPEHRRRGKRYAPQWNADRRAQRRRSGLLTDDELEQIYADEIAQAQADERDAGSERGHSSIDQGPGGYFKYANLPVDMREEIEAHLVGTGIEIPMDAELPLLEIPPELFPMRRANKLRTLRDVEDVPMEDLPPVVIAKKQDQEGYWFIDGMHRYELARKRGVKTIRAVDVGQWIKDSVGHGSIKMTAGPVRRTVVRPDRTVAKYRDMHINDIEGGYPAGTDQEPGVFPMHSLVVPKDLYHQLNPHDIEFVLDGNGHLAIPSPIARDLYQYLMTENGIESDNDVVKAVRQLPESRLKKKTIESMMMVNRGAVSVRTFNAILTGINMAANNLTAESVKGTPAVRMQPTFELEPAPKARPAATTQGNTDAGYSSFYAEMMRDTERVPVKPRYPRATKKKMKKARAVLQSVMSAYRGFLPNINLVESVSDLTDEQLKKLGTQAWDVRGFFDEEYPPNGITVVVGNIRDDNVFGLEQSIAETIMHELVGHYGLRGLMGSDAGMQKIAAQFVEAFPDDASWRIRGIAALYGVSPEEVRKTPHLLAQAGEEIFAYKTGQWLSKSLVMTPPQRTLFQQAIDYVKQWLRNNGLDKYFGKRFKKAVQMNDRDIARLIARAQDFVMSGKPWRYETRTGDRWLLYMRDADMFESGLALTIERGMRQLSKAERKSNPAWADLTEIPLFGEHDSITKIIESFTRAQAQGLLTKGEIEDSKIFEKLRINPVQWLMDRLPQTDEMFANNVGIPMADLKKLLAGEAIPQKYIDKLISYAKSEPVEAVAPGLKEDTRLSAEAFKAGTVMTNIQLLNILQAARPGERGSSAATFWDVGKEMLPPRLAQELEQLHDIINRMTPLTFKKGKGAEEAKEAVRAASERVTEIEDTPVDMKNTRIPKAVLHGYIKNGYFTNVMARDYRDIANVTEQAAYELLTGRSWSQRGEITPEMRGVLQEEIRKAEKLGYNLGFDPETQRWLDKAFSPSRGEYTSFVPISAKEEDYREIVFYHTGVDRTQLLMPEPSHFKDKTAIRNAWHFMHMRIGVGRDADPNPPAAANPAMTGKTLTLAEMQSDSFQRLSAFVTQNEFAKAMEQQKKDLVTVNLGVQNLGSAVGVRIGSTIQKLIESVEVTPEMQETAERTARAYINSYGLGEETHPALTKNAVIAQQYSVIAPKLAEIEAKILGQLTKFMPASQVPLVIGDARAKEYLNQKIAYAFFDAMRSGITGSIVNLRSSSGVGRGGIANESKMKEAYDQFHKLGLMLRNGGGRITYSALAMQHITAGLNDIYSAIDLPAETVAEDLDSMNHTSSAHIIFPNSLWKDYELQGLELRESLLVHEPQYTNVYRSAGFSMDDIHLDMTNSDHTIISFSGPAARAEAFFTAYKAALSQVITTKLIQWKVHANEVARQPGDTNIEDMYDWLGMETESTDDEDLGAYGLTTRQEYIDDGIGEWISNRNARDYIDLSVSHSEINDFAGETIDETNQEYINRVVDDPDNEDVEPDTDAAEEWLQSRRDEIEEQIIDQRMTDTQEPDGQMYQAAEESLGDSYDEDAPWVRRGHIPVEWEEDGSVSRNDDIAVIYKGFGDYYIINIGDGTIEENVGRRSALGARLIQYTKQYYEEKDIIPPANAGIPWQEKESEPQLDISQAKHMEIAEAVIAGSSEGTEKITADIKKVTERYVKSLAQLEWSKVTNAPFADGQWRIIGLRYLLADAVRRGFAKIQWTGGDAGPARGGYGAAWAQHASMTWTLEDFTFAGKPKKYLVVRTPESHPLVLDPEADMTTGVLGRHVMDHIAKQMAGTAPRSHGEKPTIEPSENDLLVTRVAGQASETWIISRKGKDKVLGVARSLEELDALKHRLVEEAKAAGGWDPDAVSRRQRTVRSGKTKDQITVGIPIPPPDIEQWGEILPQDIGAETIQIIRQNVEEDFNQKVTAHLGARVSLDRINNRIWNKELAKYGASITEGVAKISGSDLSDARYQQGAVTPVGLPQAIRDVHGEIKVEELAGDTHGYMVVGRDGPVLPTIFRDPDAAETAMKEWIRDTMAGGSGDAVIKVNEIVINDKIREVFQYSQSPFMMNPRDNPHLKSAADKIGSKQPKLGERYQEWRAMAKHTFVQGALDRFYGIKRAMKEAGLAGLEADINPYIQARLSTSLDAVMRGVMEFGYPVWKEGMAQTEGEGLLEVLSEVAGDIELWTMYMAGVRAQRLTREQREKLFTEDEIRHMVALGETYPAFKRTAAKYAAFNKKVLDFAQEAGVINAETRPLWENADYIPFYRVKDDRLVGAMSGSAGIANVNSPIKKLKGGKDNVGDLMHNIMINLTKLVDSAMKNHAALMAVDALRPHGIISNQPMAWSEQLIPMEQVKKALIERGVDPATIPAEALTGFQKMFAMQAPKGDGIISVMRNGKKEFYYTDDILLYRAMTAINKKHFGPLMNLLRAPKRLLTTWITLDPGFMVANFLRDSLSSFVLSRDAIVPLASGTVGFMKALGTSEELRIMLSAGAAFENGYADQYDPDSTKRMMKRLMKSKKPTDIILDSPAKLYHLWKRLGSATENANRIAVYNAALRSGKSKAQAAFEAKDLMDFSMGGDWGVVQFLIQTVPFLGARVQGLHRLGRGFRENPVAFTFKGVLVGLAGMALWSLFKDDERYKELEDWDKDTYFHFWIGDNHYRLPKPFEVGAIFNTIPERIFEYINSQEDDAGKQLLRRWGWMLGNTFNMNPIPQAILPMVEGWFNHNFFTGRQIESPYEEERLPPERLRANTSPTMVELGRAMPAWLDQVSNKIRSPLQLQNLYEGYTGTLGKYFLMASDAMIRESMDLPEPPALRKADYPVLGRFSLGSEPRRTRYEEEFYRTLRRAVQVQGSVKFLDDASEDQRLEYIEGKYDPYIAVSRDLERARQEVSSINKEMREIYLDRDMSRETKREQIDQLQLEKNQVFKDAYELRPGGSENQTIGRISVEQTRFFIDQFNSDKPSPELAKAAPMTAELLNDIRSLSPRNVKALAKVSGAPE